MKSMNRLYVPVQSRRGRRHVRYFCLGIVCAVSLIGCVSKSRYESVASEMDGLRAELGRAQAEVHALEQQRAALEKLNLDGERLLATIRKELQQARAGYEEYKAEQGRLDGLKAKARALQSEQQKHIQGIKAAKRDELNMQAVIDRYEKDMQQVPDVGDVLRVSQAAEPKDDGSRLVATVTPLPEEPSATTNASTAAVQPMSAPQVATGPSVAPAPATMAAPSPTPTGPAQTAVAKPTAAPASKPQPAPAEESWIGSLTGWLSSVWGWLFS
ncbi:MAG TPA: hypothetical protein VJ805_04520 [Nitrospiraceae bacterium]|nr:hypothetical protein [Nitrospiraceae bacterium]